MAIQDLRAIAALHLVNLSMRRDKAGRICLPVQARPIWLCGKVLRKAEQRVSAGDYEALEADLTDAVWRYSEKLGGVARRAGVDFILRDICAELGPAQANRVVQRALGVAADGVLDAQARAVLRGAETEPAPLLRALGQARKDAGSDPVRARGALRVAQVLSPRATGLPLTERVA